MPRIGIDLADLEGVIVEGTTSGTANTALDTLTPNPLNRIDVWVLVLGGAGVYIEHSATSGSQRADGITATTIDVRSTNTSEPFIIFVTPIRRTFVHAA